MDLAIESRSRSQQPRDKGSGANPGDAQSGGEWTLAIDLAADVRDQMAKLTGAGSFDKWQQIKKLSAQTKDSPVSFVVSLPHDDATAADLGSLRQMRDHGAAWSFNQNISAPPAIDTYLVRNGQIKLLESRPSAGMAKDVERLLTTAQQAAPAQHLGLSIFAHGMGTEDGMMGDTGSATLSQLHDAMAGALVAGKKLDIIDFDGCDMASTDTAWRMQDVARQMVASEDVEAASLLHAFDGQNTTATLQYLIAHPHASARQLAVGIVEQADAGADGLPARLTDDKLHAHSGSDTLTAFDLTHFGEFADRLNDFASALRPQSATADGAAAIAKAIDDTQAFPTAAVPAVDLLRDTRQFAQKIIGQIQQGRLLDPDGAIRRAAQAMLAAQQAITERSYRRPGMYGDIGGLSAFLPVSSEQSRLQMATKLSGVNAALIDIPPFETRFANKSVVTLNARMIVGNLHACLPAAEQKALSGLDSAMAQVEASENQQQYGDAVHNLTQAARQFLKSPAGRKVVTDTALTMHPSDSGAPDSQWNRLIDELQTASRSSR